MTDITGLQAIAFFSGFLLVAALIVGADTVIRYGRTQPHHTIRFAMKTGYGCE